MKSRLLASVALAVLIVGASSVHAVEPYLEFVRGLRDQQYFDYAILYLDQIATKDTTPADVKQVISYQKAMILQESAKSAKSPEKQLEQLSQAQAFLEEFVKENPSSPIAADANSDRATIMLNKGQAEIMQSKSPSGQGGKKQLQASARALIAKAREVFQTAFDQHEANFKKFGVFIDQQKDPEQYAARSKIEQNLMTASLSLAICTYEEAHTYDSSAIEYKQLLTKAADEFEKMHQKYRSQVGGLNARAWQGKCYEEQNDLQKAMGIYNELLEHPGDTGALSQLKTQTLYFKLICLNSKDRHDYRVAADLAEEWIKKHPNELRTRMGLSIQWEQALAYESLGDNREILKAEKESLWKQARTISMQIQKFPSEHKDAATALTQRLQAKLGGKEDKINDFDTAFGLARQAFLDSQEIKKEIDDGIKNKRPKEEIDKLKIDKSNQLNDATRYFEMSFNLTKPTDEKKNISTARLFYAHVQYELDKYYEAAVLGQYVARTVDKEDGNLGLDAAYLAMASFVQAYNANNGPPDKKEEDLKMIVKASNLIAERWPSSDKANGAYMMLGKMLSVQKKPAESAMWFGKVPESDPKYSEAQLAAGQAYWSAYIGAGKMIAAEKPSSEQLAAWQKSAQDHLKVGIDKITATAPKEASPADLIGAKMTLAQIVISQGKDADALKLLIDDPHSVVKAVTVKEETARPEKGVTSRRFAMETYKLVFRAYIGTQNLDKARESMKELEKIAAAGGVDGGAEVTDLYVGLGRLLKEELQRFRDNGETERFDKLMSSFETFLNDMAGRKEGQTFGSLSWIGETYFALGETASADAAKANSFYDRAGNAFQEILTRAKDDQNFASSKQLQEVKLRMVRVLRLKKDFAPAETLINEIVKENANNLKVQIAAAELYQDWGSSGQADSTKKLILAIQGNTKVNNGLIWGWGQIAFKLQKSQEYPNNPYYFETFLEARYNGTVCRHRFAREQSAKKKQEALEGCLTELVATSAVTKNMPDEQYQKFNALYREVLADAGKPVADLPKTQDVPVSAPHHDEPTPEEVAKKVEATKKAEELPKPPPGIDATTWTIFGACLVFGLGSIVWVLVKGKSKPKQKSFGTAPIAGPVSFSGVSIGDAPAPATFVAPKPKPRPASAAGTAPAAATGVKPASKPATKPAAPGAAGAAAPKPRPKPPSPPAAK